LLACVCVCVCVWRCRRFAWKHKHHTRAQMSAYAQARCYWCAVYTRVCVHVAHSLRKTTAGNAELIALVAHEGAPRSHAMSKLLSVSRCGNLSMLRMKRDTRPSVQWRCCWPCGCGICTEILFPHLNTTPSLICVDAELTTAVSCLMLVYCVCMSVCVC
jgi:hypothetical protein